MALEAELVDHLSRFRAAPFLFVGSGFGRRYVNSDDWASLLKRFADATGVPYERYSSKAAGDFPRIASEIANDFHDVWWESPLYQASRLANPNPVNVASPLKIEIARLLADLPGQLPREGDLFEELELLRAATVEGAITTNYDPLLEAVFPDYRVFAGQEELLFHDAAGVGEIYKIHGSCSKPETLVLTADDYDQFTDRNVYLAAKLLTIFVEHPIVFIGYSLTDANVRELLASIARVLTKENITKLQDRLIFIEWSENAKDSHLTPIPFPIDGMTLPMVGAKVADFKDVFSAMGRIRRRFSAKFLRELKDEIYDLVRTSEPKGSLYVMDIDADVDVADVDVVIGVGIQNRLAAQGVVGLSRRDLLSDVLRPSLPTGDAEAMHEIVAEVLPRNLRRGTRTPIFRYLAAAGELNAVGGLKSPDRVPVLVRGRAEEGLAALRAPGSYVRRALERVKTVESFAELVEQYAPNEVIFAAPHMDPSAVDPQDLRQFLIATEDALFVNGHSLHATQWAKCLCFLDYLEYGPGASARAEKPRHQGAAA